MSFWKKFLLFILWLLLIFSTIFYFFYNAVLNTWDIVFKSKDSWYSVFIDADFSSFSENINCEKICSFKEIPVWKYSFYATLKGKETFYWNFEIDKNKKKFKNIKFENIVSLDKVLDKNNLSNSDKKNEFSFKKDWNKYDILHFDKSIYSFVWDNLDWKKIDKVYPFSWEYVFVDWNDVTIFTDSNTLLRTKISSLKYVKRMDGNLYFVTEKWVFSFFNNKLEYIWIFDDFVLDSSWKYVWVINPWKNNKIISRISNNYTIVSYSPISKNHKILLDTREKVDKIFIEDWNIKIFNQKGELLIVNL